MYSASSGVPPWQPAGSYGAVNYAQNAYIPVPARHTFASPSNLPPPPSYVPAPLSAQPQSSMSPASASASASPTAGQPAKKKVEWSSEVREYVSRSFAQENSISGISRQDLEAKLKHIITEAAQNGGLNIINWKTLPLPQQMLQEERKRSVLSPAYQPPATSFVPVPPPPEFTYHNQPPPLETLRKRKSSELPTDDQPIPQAPWRINNIGISANHVGGLADRVTFAPPEKRTKVEILKPNSKSNASLEQRKKRFEDIRGGSHSPNTPRTPRAASPEPENKGPIVGRSQKLEKNYFRLTSAPNPDDVRPLEVLRKTLDLLKKKWRSDGNYTYICDQFKSLRQDLTVQHLKNDFTTTVYEIHARIALEKGDLGEYNQCQTQLRMLYKQNLGGHPVEFKAYRILYFIHTCNRTDLNDVLSDLTTADKSEPAIKHALEVRSALALGNYHKFFKLYLAVPNMGAYLMDMFVERERLAALACICKSYRPDVKLRFVTEELSFEHDEETAQFVLDHAPDGNNELLQERDGHVRLMTGKAGQIFEAGRAAAFRHVDIKGQI